MWDIIVHFTDNNAEILWSEDLKGAKKLQKKVLKKGVMIPKKESESIYYPFHSILKIQIKPRK